jgi:hypothetical protein
MRIGDRRDGDRSSSSCTASTAGNSLCASIKGSRTDSTRGRRVGGATACAGCTGAAALVDAEGAPWGAIGVEEALLAVACVEDTGAAPPGDKRPRSRVPAAIALGPTGKEES